jgi:ABC-2 type transport system permease protein
MSSSTIPGRTVRAPTTSGSGLLARTLRAELLRARQGRQLVSLALGAIVLCLITSYALAAGVQSGASPQSAAELTEGQVRAWMMTFLLAAIFGSMVFTRDVGTGALTRSVLSGSRASVFAAKVIVSAVAGLGYGVLAAVMSFVTTYAVNAGLGVPFEWTREATLIAVGITACCVLAAVFGLFVGMLARSGAVALIVLLLQTLLVEPGLQRIAPDAAKYLFTIALSSVYRDVLPHLLPLALGALVAVAWIAVLGVLAWLRFVRKDVRTS